MLQQVIDITKQAGDMAHRQFGRVGEADIARKSPADLVTKVDKEIEGFLRDALPRAFPGVGFLGEEGDDGRLDEHERVFVVDPLDGTTSFVHGHPFYSVSVGYREQGRSQLGVVYLPYLNQVFWAERGKGAFRDGRRLHVSPTDRLIDSLVATGFACVRSRLKPDNVPLFSDVIYRVRAVRRCGSAAIDCCYVAAGIYELFWELHLQPWDIAAGMLIVEEAGGRITNIEGRPHAGGCGTFVASNGRVLDEFLAIARARMGTDCRPRPNVRP